MVHTALMSDLVSVLIPCFNAAPWLRACLDSVAAQTWPTVEIILVDDGSTDASAEIATRFFQEKPLGRLIRQKNAGAAAARQRALSEANGQFIQYLDADDVLHAEKISRQLERLLRSPSHVASGPWVRFTDKPDTTPASPELNWKDLGPAEFLQVTFESGSMMHPAAWLVPTPIAQKAGPWNTSLSLDDDGEYFARVVVNSSGILFCDQATTYYRSNLSGSLSGRHDRRAWQSAYEVCRLSTKLLLRADNSRRSQAACARYWMNLAFAAYPTGGDIVDRALKNAQHLDPTVRMTARGKRFELVSRWFGWKVAKHLQCATAPLSGRRQ